MLLIGVEDAANFPASKFPKFPQFGPCNLYLRGESFGPPSPVCSADKVISLLQVCCFLVNGWRKGWSIPPPTVSSPHPRDVSFTTSITYNNLPDESVMCPYYTDRFNISLLSYSSELGLTFSSSCKTCSFRTSLESVSHSHRSKILFFFHPFSPSGSGLTDLLFLPHRTFSAFL